MTPPSPTLGWYPDPTDPLGELWWDGLRWRPETRRPLNPAAPPAGTNPPQMTPIWTPSSTPPSPSNSAKFRREASWIIAGAGGLALTVVVAVVIIWGLLTHGFRDTKSYNMGYDMGNRDKHGEYTAGSGYRVGCDVLFSLAFDPRRNADLIADDFRAGCQRAEK